MMTEDEENQLKDAIWNAYYTNRVEPLIDRLLDAIKPLIERAIARERDETLREMLKWKEWRDLTIIE